MPLRLEGTAVGRTMTSLGPTRLKGSTVFHCCIFSGRLAAQSDLDGEGETPRVGGIARLSGGVWGESIRDRETGRMGSASSFCVKKSKVDRVNCFRSLLKMSRTLKLYNS